MYVRLWGCSIPLCYHPGPIDVTSTALWCAWIFPPPTVKGYVASLIIMPSLALLFLQRTRKFGGIIASMIVFLNCCWVELLPFWLVYNSVNHYASFSLLFFAYLRAEWITNAPRFPCKREFGWETCSSHTCMHGRGNSHRLPLHFLPHAQVPILWSNLPGDLNEGGNGPRDGLPRPHSVIMPTILKPPRQRPMNRSHASFFVIGSLD